MHRGKLRLLTILLFIMTSGCGDQRILEDLGFVSAIGYDLPKEQAEDSKGIQKLEVTAAIPRADPEEPKGTDILSTVALSNREARVKLSRQSDSVLVGGQLRSTLHGLELARKGIWEYTEALVRDPEIGERVHVVVVNGRAGELLKKEYKTIPKPGVYLYELLAKEAREHAIPNINLYQFSRDLLDDGTDPIAPMIKSGKETIVTDGVALFADDKYKTKIEPIDTLIFMFLRGEKKQGDLTAEITEEGKKTLVSLTSIVSKRKVKVTPATNPSQTKVEIHI